MAAKNRSETFYLFSGIIIGRWGGLAMGTIRTWIAAGIAAAAFASLAVAQNDLTPKNRQELKHEDVPGTNMEIILSVAEYQPGDILSRHFSFGTLAAANRSITLLSIPQVTGLTKPSGGGGE